MIEESHVDYISDLARILIEKLEELKTESKKDNHIKGQIFAYYDALDLIKSQAMLFEIAIPELDDITLEEYLS
ncbi:hypothetical protein [Kordia sp.]|uniref:hypothetical protein n=1 Tax=Kordia sp. TaxID=1965332 RepID=UPI003B5B140C